MLRVISLLLSGILLSAAAQAAVPDNSISFVTGIDDVDFKYTRRIGPVELSVNPGAFSLIKSWLYYNYAHTLYYDPALYVAIRLPLSEGFALKPEAKMGYEYALYKRQYPYYDDWNLEPIYPGTSDTSSYAAHHYRELTQGSNISVRMNFEFTSGRLLLGFYPGLDFVSRIKTANTDPGYGWRPSTDGHYTMSELGFGIVFGLYSGINF